MKYLPLLVLCALPACHALPRDPAGTSTRIATEKRFVVGETETGMAGRPEVQMLIARIEQRTGARAQWRKGQGEALLQQLDQGKIDLIFGRFRKDSPWRTDVVFGPPLSSSGPNEDPVELKTAMRNGENRWIMTVERASRAVAKAPRS